MKYKPNTYLAFELSPTARGELLKAFPPKFAKVVCHHVTLAFRPTEEQFNELIAKYLHPEVLAVGYSSDDSLECISVTVNGESKRQVGGYYHVTHSLGAGRKPVDSNKLLEAQGGVPTVKLAPLKLKGELKLISL